MINYRLIRRCENGTRRYIILYNKIIVSIYCTGTLIVNIILNLKGKKWMAEPKYTKLSHL